MSSPVIAVLAFQHISPFHLSVPCVVFGDRHPGCQLSLARLRGGCRPHPHLGRFFHCLRLRAGRAGRGRHHHPAQLAGRQAGAGRTGAGLAAGSGARVQIVGLCLGAYVLAEAGLLDGRNATTHWAYAEDFARRYPQVRLDPAVLYVEDGQMLTSAGTAAGLDCCLHLLRQRYGAELANGVARRLVVPPHRQGGQAQFIEQPLPVSAGDSRLAGLLDWVRANLAQTTPWIAWRPAWP
jgi:hypothetical protein